MRLKLVVACLIYWVLTFDLHAQAEVTTTTIGSGTQSVVDAKPAAENQHYLKECNITKGDSLEKVKLFYRIDSEPHQNTSSTKLKQSTSYTYHFEEYGVWIFFDENKNVRSMRFNHPFVGKVAGVAIGDSSDPILELHGEPDIKNENGLFDLDSYRNRETEIEQLLNSMPDPAPRELVLRVVTDIRKIDKKPLTRTTSWLYKPGSNEFLNFQVSPIDQQVKYIFSGTCRS